MNGFPHSELVSAFDQLTSQLQQLAERLHASQLPLWVPLTDAEQDAGISPRAKAIALYCNLWHQGDGDGRVTESRHGLVAIDAATAQQVHAVNQAKQCFHHAIAPFRQQQAEWRAELQHRGVALREALASKGLTRLHLKQCYRQLPLLEQQPLRVGFNWYSSGRSIKRMTVQQVQEALLKLGADKPHIALQLAQLNALNAATPLAQVQQQAPLMRCNLRLNDQGDRLAMNLSLPLLFVHDANQPFPDFNQPPLSAPSDRQRQVRSDCRLEPDALLPSLRIHRYRSDR